MKERFAACLLGGAVGDALGYTVEFMHWPQIESWFGPRGIIEPQMDSRTGKALISDDTQMSLFTLDGIIWAYTSGQNYVTGGLYPSYLRWLYTQTGTVIQPGVLDRQPHETEDGILAQKELFFRRAPGSACLSALRSGKMGTMDNPINDSKGCGGMMRAAPIGLFLHADPAYAFRIAAEGAAITHGHPTGYLAAGVFAAIIALLICDVRLSIACDEAAAMLRRYEGYEEVLRAMDNAREMSESSLQTIRAIRKLGGGWVAEEALAIGLCCALRAVSFQQALTASVNHDGDSDTTGTVCGHILGAGSKFSVPAEWTQKLELGPYIARRGRELCQLRERARARA
jgi:ADP-ribosylglycohydrolase